MKTLKLFSVLVLVFAFSINQMLAQVITGQVTSADDGSLLPGVSVVIKGSNIGTITNVEGEYSLRVNNSNDILVFSMVGMNTKEVELNGRTVINVALESSQVEIEEVVVTSLGITRTQKCVSYSSTVVCGSVAGVSIQSEVPYFPAPQYNTEGYSTVNENGFKKVSLNPLSTFSIDVDGASYSNLRRYLNSGSLPPKDAVRIEEMINYFSYDYPQPDNDAPFSINHELSVCPWNTDHYLMYVGLQGKKIATENLPASNLVFLIDVSGSMEDSNKLPLLVASFKLLVDQLRAEDKVAIVVYAGSSGLVLPSTSGKNKEEIKEALNNLRAGGSTAGGEGLKLAYKTAEKNFIENGNNRIILATDGDFNVGASSNAEMERLIEKEREKGIAISVLGFGMGNYKDDKMEIIADKGNGNYSYIDNLQEAKKVLVNEFGGTLFTIAKDVKFQLEFNPARVKEYRLIGYENRLLNEEDFEDDKKDAGEMGAGHTVTALYEIVPAKTKTKTRDLIYQQTELTEEAILSYDLLTLKLRYKEPNGYESKLIAKAVPDQLVTNDEASDNFRFAAAIAEFGMLLLDSEHKGSATFKSAIKLAKSAKGDDEEGYRGEMVRLIKSAELLMSGTAEK